MKNTGSLTDEGTGGLALSQAGCREWFPEDLGQPFRINPNRDKVAKPLNLPADQSRAVPGERNLVPDRRTFGRKSEVWNRALWQREPSVKAERPQPNRGAADGRVMGGLQGGESGARSVLEMTEGSQREGA